MTPASKTFASISWRSLITLIVLILMLIWFAVATFPFLPSAQEQRDQHLIDSVRSRDAAAAGRLIAEGANPNIHDYYHRPVFRPGVSLLAIAAAQDDLPTLIVLLEHGADVNAKSDPVAWEASRRGTRLLRDNTAIDDSEVYLGRTTPLMEAIHYDNLAAVRLLLKQGASVNVTNEGGATPLMLAAHDGRPTAAQLLIAAGASVNGQDHQGDTPLTEAIRSGNPRIVQMLLAHGAVTAVNTDPTALFPLSIGPANPISLALSQLFQKGLLYDINAPNAAGRTLLMAAIDSGRLDLVRFLVAHGADVNARYTPGNTPLDEARQHKMPEIEAFLRVHGAWPASRQRPLFRLPPPVPLTGSYAALPNDPVSVNLARSSKSAIPIPARFGHHNGAAFAVPLSGTIPSGRVGPEGTRAWASPSQFLDLRYPNEFFLRNVWTGQDTPLPTLTAAWNRQMPWNTQSPRYKWDTNGWWHLEPTFRLSDDGQWLLGQTKGGWFATTIQGTQPHLWPPEKIGSLSLSYWLPDGR
jgi:ankyrin repeat protein